MGLDDVTEASLDVVLFKPTDPICLIRAACGETHLLAGPRLCKSKAVAGDDGPRFWIATYGLSVIQQNDGVAIRRHLNSAIAGGL